MHKFYIHNTQFITYT